MIQPCWEMIVNSGFDEEGDCGFRRLSSGTLKAGFAELHDILHIHWFGIESRLIASHLIGFCLETPPRSAHTSVACKTNGMQQTVWKVFHKGLSKEFYARW